MTNRLSDEERKAILTGGVEFYTDDGGARGVARGPFELCHLTNDQVMRALKIAAHLDAIPHEHVHRIVAVLGEIESQRTRVASARDDDSPELAEAHRGVADACHQIQEALWEP